MPSRRAALALPLLLLPRRRATAGGIVPPFRDWVGQTARLSGDGGQARLLLIGDHSGLMAVKLLFFCQALPIHWWEMAEDGLTMAYRRASALDPARVIEGEARILAEEGQVMWIEALSRLAAFEGFAPAEAAGRCG